MKKAVLAITVIVVIALSLFILVACDDGGDKDVEDVDEKVLFTSQDVIMITEKTTYPSDVRSIRAVWKNGTEKSLTFGDSFYLEKKVKGGWKWEKVELPGTVTFGDIGYTLLPNAQGEHTYPISTIYGDLEVGNYRIVTRYFDKAPATAGDAQWVFAEFALVNEAADTEGIRTDNDLFSEYGIEITDWYIWNDYMPSAYMDDDMPPEGWIRPTLCVIHINSKKPLPSIAVFATIISAAYRLENIPFHLNSGWRPMIDFNILGDYTMEITVQVGNRRQTVAVQGTVQTTW
jgi:hypothetical protein